MDPIHLCKKPCSSRSLNNQSIKMIASLRWWNMMHLDRPRRSSLLLLLCSCNVRTTHSMWNMRKKNMIAEYLISSKILNANVKEIHTAHEGAKPHPPPIPPPIPPKGNWAEATPDSARTIVENFISANLVFSRSSYFKFKFSPREGPTADYIVVSKEVGPPLNATRTAVVGKSGLVRP